MTLQDLKDNRNEIISYIESTMGNEMVKEVMNQLVLFLGFNGIESSDVISYTKEVIKLADIKAPVKERVNTLWGPGCKYSTQAEYQRSCMGKKWN